MASFETSLETSVVPLLRELVEQRRVPGIVLAVQQGEGQVLRWAVGSDAADQPVSEDSFFIVASITKMATALAVLRLVDRGVLGLDDQIGDHLPMAACASGDVTLRSLLCHTSGLPTDIAAEYAPYQHGLDWHALGEAALLTPLAAQPWTRVQYSNVGYGLLGLVVQEHMGKRFPEALSELVLEPLGIEGYLGSEPPRPPARLADVRGDRASDPDLEPFNSVFYRSLAMPWAGLVTTADGALRIVRAFAGWPADFLKEATRRAATSDQTRGLNGGFQPPLMWNPSPWGLGPELHGHKEPHWLPRDANPESFGHSGASGCLAWYDPRTNCSWAMIGTRTADNGWLLRRGSAVSGAILASAEEGT